MVRFLSAPIPLSLVALAVTAPLSSIVILPFALMPSDAPVALTLPEPLIARSPPALMASNPVLVALTDPAPSMLILPVERIASSVDVTLSVPPSSPWILSSAFSLVP